jgi:hypothetical protein
VNPTTARAGAKTVTITLRGKNFVRESRVQ